MNVLLYRPLVMIRNVESAFQPMWEAQEKDTAQSDISWNAMLWAAAKRAATLQTQPDAINYAGKGQAPAFQRELEYLRSILPEESFKSATGPKKSTKKYINTVYYFIYLSAVARRFKRFKKSPTLLPSVKEKYFYFLAEFLAYSRLMQKKTARPRAVVVHALFAPRALSIITAAIKEKVPSIFILHGAFSATPKNYRFPIFPVDLHLIKSEASQRGIHLHTNPTLNVAYYGIPGPEAPLRPIPEHIQTLGICLTHAVVERELEKKLKELQKHLQPERIRIRFHPRDPKAETFSQTGIQISPKSETVQDFSNQCDLVIAGNTSSIIEMLKAGTPVIYLSSLDLLAEDLCGLAGNKVVPGFPEVNDISLRESRAIFADPAWIKRFCFFDPSYEKSREQINQEMRQRTLDIL